MGLFDTSDSTGVSRRILTLPAPDRRCRGRPALERDHQPCRRQAGNGQVADAPSRPAPGAGRAGCSPPDVRLRIRSARGRRFRLEGPRIRGRLSREHRRHPEAEAGDARDRHRRSHDHPLARAREECPARRAPEQVALRRKPDPAPEPRSVEVAKGAASIRQNDLANARHAGPLAWTSPLLRASSSITERAAKDSRTQSTIA